MAKNMLEKQGPQSESLLRQAAVQYVRQEYSILGMDVNVLQQSYLLGDIQAFTAYVRNFTRPISQFAQMSSQMQSMAAATQMSSQMQSMAAATERVFSFLDEATSNVDTLTEHRIQRAMHKLMQGRTSFVIAHRLSTIKEADLLLVMENGDIKEQGTHESLMHSGGLYAELYNSQFDAVG